METASLSASSHPSTSTLLAYTDSFPLVPLPVIPQLTLTELEKVQDGLNDLLGSVVSHHHNDHHHLYAYATRQLSLVQHHLTHHRAQERVKHLLRGDVFAPLPADSSTKKALFSSNHPTKQEQPVASKPCSFGNRKTTLQWKSKQAVEMARTKAMKTNSAPVLTSFVISNGANASKRQRGRRKRQQQLTLKEETKAEERATRRLAAMQRLQARRELQAIKKREMKSVKKKEKREKKQESKKTKVEKEATDESDEESETSDVSNCSESDEANEQAILALKLSSHSSTMELNDQRDVAGENKVENDSKKLKDVVTCYEFGSNGGDDSFRKNDFHNLDSEIETTQSLENRNDVSMDESGYEQLQRDNNFFSAKEQEKEKKRAFFEFDESSSFDLQRFLTIRTAAMLEQLQAQESASTAAYDPTDDIAARKEEDPITNETLSQSDQSQAKSCEILPTSSWINEIRQSADEIRDKISEPDKQHSLGFLYRVPVAECKDYRVYFRTFQCILTSVFEQSRESCVSTCSLYQRSKGDETMKLQQKLYESWQTIMDDYATVFGRTKKKFFFGVPEKMVPDGTMKPWTPHYRINSTARKEVAEIVIQALERVDCDWEAHPSGLGLKTTWNLLWTWSKPRVERQTLLVWQKVNHFHQMKTLTRKDCLKKQIGKYRRAGGRLRQAFDIIPPTYVLPKEYLAFVQAFQERTERLRGQGMAEEKNIWIMKPVALSRGRGISLINDLNQVIYGEQVIIQEYIGAPRLLDGYKFDLRLYVLVTSFNPLEAFLYDEGFVRLCTRPYQDSDISNVFVHLTNSSIQKENREVRDGGTMNPVRTILNEKDSTTVQNETELVRLETGGTKTTLAYLWARLAAEGVDVEQVKRNIDEVVLKALVCGEDAIPFQVNSFDLLGYDILLDKDLRPWLIEINSSPSMARDTELDYLVKDAMMLDTLSLVNPLPFDRTKLAEVIARRQREVDNEKKRPHVHTRHPRENEEIAARQLNEDLTGILRGQIPRAYGEMPEKMGMYRRLCPHTSTYNHVLKLKKSYMRT